MLWINKIFPLDYHLDYYHDEVIFLKKKEILTKRETGYVLGHYSIIRFNEDIYKNPDLLRFRSCFCYGQWKNEGFQEYFRKYTGHRLGVPLVYIYR